MSQNIIDLSIVSTDSDLSKRTAPFYVESLVGFNMFPGCEHVETVAILHRCPDLEGTPPKKISTLSLQTNKPRSDELWAKATVYIDHTTRHASSFSSPSSAANLSASSRSLFNLFFSCSASYICLCSATGSSSSSTTSNGTMHMSGRLMLLSTFDNETPSPKYSKECRFPRAP